MIYLVLLPVFFLLMLSYFQIAERYNVIDQPNERSSHNAPVIRGGGIIFLFAAFIELFLLPELWLPVLAIIIIGIISFLDDIFTLPGRARILVHLVCVTLIFYHFNIFSKLPVYWVIGLYILVTGVINAYNFMDGINGITGAYSVVILAGLQYINVMQVNFIEPDMIWLPMLVCLVFLYFNFRKTAKCFAGDVGSITIAFWIIILLMQLILVTHNLIYVLFLTVYGVDSVFTIIHRLLLKQNIFRAHRLHFYQLLTNKYRWPHLLVSSIYAFIQFCIILLIIINETKPGIIIVISCVPLVLAYLFFKPALMRGYRSTRNKSVRF